MASNTAMPSGYDYEFVEEVSEDYICVICQLAMRNPVQARCGHQFCKECLAEAYKRNPNTCPFDQGSLTVHDVFPNKFAERKILSFQIKCPHQGCDWQGELRDIESHESRCDYKVVDCDNKRCKVRKPRREMVGHVKEECQYRMVPCPHCKNTYTFCLLEEHTSQCPKCPVICPNDCGNTMKRQEVESHLTDECPLTIVPCSYQNIGCSFEVKRKDLNDHIENQVKQHLDIAVEKIVSLHETIDEVKKQMMEYLQEQIDDMKKAVNLANSLTQKQMNEMREAAILTSEHSKEQMDEVKKQMQHLQKQMDEVKKESKGRFSYIWEIKGTLISHRITSSLFQVAPISSDPFYTHKNGYKLQLRWLNQSVHLYVRCGEYDNILTWPFFVEKVKFILLDQSSEQSNIEMSAVIGACSPMVVQKPKDFDTSLARCNVCVHLRELDTDLESFIVDDTLFLKLEIESSNL